MFITVALFREAWHWVGILERFWRTGYVFSVIGTVDRVVSTHQVPEVNGCFLAFLFIGSIVDVTVTHAVSTIVSASGRIVSSFDFTPTLLLHSWPWVTSKGRYRTVGPFFIGGVFGDSQPVSHLIK